MSSKKKTNIAFDDPLQLLHTVIDIIEEEVFVKDTCGIYQYVNNSFCKNFKVNKNEVIGKDDYFIFSPEVAKILQENDKLIMQSKTTKTIEESGDVNGELLTYRTNKIPLIDEDGKVYGICGIGFDITKEKRYKKERDEYIKQLKEALAQTKLLKGLLPICANCKKIRDDKGYWNLIEVYIQDHSDAEFSHGLCEECSEKLYGKEKWYKKTKEKKQDK